MSSKNIIEYLNENKILWFPIIMENKIPVYVNIDGISYQPKSTDFRTLKEKEILKRQTIDKTKYKYIAIDTNYIKQIDIDVPHNYFEDLKESVPYYESVSKKYPHFFFKGTKKGDRKSMDYGDILTGQWSYCIKDSQVYNSNKEIPDIDYKSLPKGNVIKEKIQKMKENKLHYQGVNEWLKYCHILNKWTKELGYTENGSKYFIHLFSNDCIKYDQNAINMIDKLNTNFDETGSIEIIEQAIKKTKKIEKKKDITENYDETRTYENVKEMVEETGINGFKYFKLEIPYKEKLFYKYNETLWKLGKPFLFGMSESDLKTHLKEQFCINEEGDYVPFYDLWSIDPNKKKYYSINFFNPNNEEETGVDNPFNLYRGSTFGVYKEENKDYVYDENNEDLNIIIHHMKHNLCADDKPSFQYLVNWLYFLIFKPFERNNISILIKSDVEGIGKDIFANFIKELIGADYCASVGKPEREIVGNFNEVLEGKFLIVINELNIKLTEEHEDEWKALLSEDYIYVNGKNDKVKKINNFLHFLLHTNNITPLKIGQTDRRYFVLDAYKAEAMPVEIINKFLGYKKDRRIQMLFADFLEKNHNTTENYNWQKERPINDFYRSIISNSVDNCIYETIKYLIDIYRTDENIHEIGARKLYENIKSLQTNQKTFPNETKYFNSFRIYFKPFIKEKEELINFHVYKMKSGTAKYVFDMEKIMNFLINDKKVNQDITDEIEAIREEKNTKKLEIKKE